MITVAVDAGGADLGPDEVAAGASQAARGGIGVLLFGPAEQISSVGDGVEVVDAPVSIAKAPDPGVRGPDDARGVDRPGGAGGRRRAAPQALVSGGSTGSALAAALFNLRRDRGIYRPALALPLPIPGSSPVLLLDVGANVTCRPEHMVQFAHMGSAFAQAVMGIESPAGRAAVQRRGARRRGPRSSSRCTSSSPARPAPGLNFVGNIEGTQLPERRRRRGRDGRVHRQHRAEAHRGDLAGARCARSARRR